MKAMPWLLVAVLAVTLAVGAPAQAGSSLKPTKITKIRTTPLPLYQTSTSIDPYKELKKKDLGDVTLPLKIIEVSDNEMYLIEIKGQRWWVDSSYVKVNAVATSSPLDKETIDLNEKNIGGIRGYGEDD